MSNNDVHYFNRMDFVVISSYIKRPCFGGTNFPKFPEFWSVWQKSIPKKFSFQGSFEKVKVRLSRSREVFAKLKFPPVLFEKIPSFICLVFRN